MSHEHQDGPKKAHVICPLFKNKATVTAIAIILMFSASFSAEPVICENNNILRNGDFKLKAINRNHPAFWYNWKEKPEHVECTSLNDGVFTMKSPMPIIVQSIDLTPVTAWEFELSFDAKVNDGELQAVCMGKSMRISPNKEWKRYRLSCGISQEIYSQACSVDFSITGDNAVSSLRNVSLTPKLPNTRQNALDISLESDGKYKLQGIFVANDATDFEYFYNLKAAMYLRKFLYCYYGQYYNIYIGEKKETGQTEGMICFGQSLIGQDVFSQVTAGGYAITAHNGNIFVGGKDDRASASK